MVEGSRHLRATLASKTFTGVRLLFIGRSGCPALAPSLGHGRHHLVAHARETRRTRGAFLYVQPSPGGGRSGALAAFWDRGANSDGESGLRAADLHGVDQRVGFTKGVFAASGCFWSA